MWEKITNYNSKNNIMELKYYYESKKMRKIKFRNKERELAEGGCRELP